MVGLFDNFDNKNNKLFDEELNKEWEILYREIENCKKCKLWEGRTNVVVGSGNKKSKVVFVGEGPGADEDKQGVPFVGKAGQLLDKIFEVVGLKRDEIYITNVVKCRPPNNRNPESDEIKMCAPYLKKQLELIKPQFLVALGSVATNFLFGKKMPITKVRGKWYKSKLGYWFFPTFHPSYLLRNPSRKIGSPKYLAWKDFEHIVEVLKLVEQLGDIQEVLNSDIAANRLPK